MSLIHHMEGENIQCDLYKDKEMDSSQEAVQIVMTDLMNNVFDRVDNSEPSPCDDTDEDYQFRQKRTQVDALIRNLNCMKDNGPASIGERVKKIMSEIKDMDIVQTNPNQTTEMCHNPSLEYCLEHKIASTDIRRDLCPATPPDSFDVPIEEEVMRVIVLNDNDPEIEMKLESLSEEETEFKTGAAENKKKKGLGARIVKFFKDKSK